jgi:hypothetical protein
MKVILWFGFSGNDIESVFDEFKQFRVERIGFKSFKKFRKRHYHWLLLSVEFNAKGVRCGLNTLRREVSDFLAVRIVKPTPVAKAAIAPVYLLGDVLLWIVGFAVVDIDYALAHGSNPFPFPCLPVEAAERRFNAVNDYLLDICPYWSACLSAWLTAVELQGAITFAAGILP